eukprot:CAMPEP_0195081508 /NCGR_PEP_ID=MMETSP0448-20130528/22932_1 /TAXON_ID=66468 /ORGANISM="Heterocapsa triquestra, Strain CCMP 448" /LENGTH=587 /DNA_ID=CAMNT_0040114537 /DNA_START=85 /DNA_END=1848 /DNA_ORIENTATION=-
MTAFVGLLLRSLLPGACVLPQVIAFHEHSNCDDGQLEFWSPQKRDTCCLVYGKGCLESELPPTFAPSSYESESRTIPEPRSDEVYDCNAGLSHWRTSWSRGKRAWCCSRKFSCEDEASKEDGAYKALPSESQASDAYGVLGTSTSELRASEEYEPSRPETVMPSTLLEPEPDLARTGTCDERFVAPSTPPLHATDHNGLALREVCIHKSGPYHVFVVGDWGGIGVPPTPADHRSKNAKHHRDFVIGVDDCAQVRVAQQMKLRAADSQPDYVLNVGDNFYWGGIEEKCGTPPYQCQDTTGQWHYAFESIYKGDGLEGKPWLGVLGNHDYGGFMFNRGWDRVIAYTWDTSIVSTGRWMTPAQYWRSKVRYPDFSVDYYFVDTNIFNAFEPKVDEDHNICSYSHNRHASCGPQGPTSVFDCPRWFKKLWDDQMKWLDEVLPKSTAEWQIVVTHFPPYHGKDDWIRLSQWYGIDLIITGHLHNQQVRYVDAENFLQPTAYIISGGGGGITSEGLPDFDGNDDEYGFMDLTLSPMEIKIEAISHGGKLRSTTRVKQRHPVKVGRRLFSEAGTRRDLNATGLGAHEATEPIHL